MKFWGLELPVAVRWSYINSYRQPLIFTSFICIVFLDCRERLQLNNAWRYSRMQLLMRWSVPGHQCICLHYMITHMFSVHLQRKNSSVIDTQGAV